MQLVFCFSVSSKLDLTDLSVQLFKIPHLSRFLCGSLDLSRHRFYENAAIDQILGLPTNIRQENTVD